MSTTQRRCDCCEGMIQPGRDYAITLNVNRKEVGFAVMWGNESPEAAQARIALIAAATEMLETLQSISGDAHELMRGHNLPESVLELVGAIEDAAQAAIAKAEGRS